MEERREEGERAFQKVAGLTQRRARALVQITKADGARGKSSVLAGFAPGPIGLGNLRGPGHVALPWWLWLGCWWEQPEWEQAWHSC